MVRYDSSSYRECQLFTQQTKLRNEIISIIVILHITRIWFYEYCSSLVQQVTEIQLSGLFQLSKIVVHQIINNITFAWDRFSGVVETDPFKALLFYKIGIINKACYLYMFGFSFSSKLILKLLNTQLLRRIQFCPKDVPALKYMHY